MSRRNCFQGDSGFSLVEVFIAMVMTLTMAAMVVPQTSALFGNLRLAGDARGISNTASLAKMRAAADFTKARLRVDIGARTYRIERFQKTGAIGWTAEGDPTSLSYRVNVNTGGLAAPPANTQGAIGEAPACLDNAGAAGFALPPTANPVPLFAVAGKTAVFDVESPNFSASNCSILSCAYSVARAAKWP